MMEHSRTNRKLVLFKFLHGFILLCMTTCLQSAALRSLTMLGNESDHLALLDFKKRITDDPFDVMSSWNHSIHICSWVGVSCHRSTKRVLMLNLKSRKLVGSIPPSVGNLTYLTAINLRDNNFHGKIPLEMGRLLSLQYINLSHNSFRGKFPTNLWLDLQVNQIKGSIPNQLSSLFNLKYLLLYGNNLTGTIPPWIGNFSLLSYLYLGDNNFQGNIPNELGHIPGLERFVVELNNLSGMVPSSIYNISSIEIFSVVSNQLHGELPPNLGTMLPNLVQFYCGANKFEGNIPISLSNASRLQVLELPQNDLSGTVPGESLGSLQSLVLLNIADNQLGNRKVGDLNFLSLLANCTRAIPGSIANFSTQLNYLTLGENFIHGNLPNGIGNLINLTTLELGNNYLGGSVPHEIGKLEKLEKLYLDSNIFSGSIPSSLGNMTSLLNLYMGGNRILMISGFCSIIVFFMFFVEWLIMQKEEFKYSNLTPTNTEVFCDKTPHLTDCACGNYKLGTISVLLEVGLWPSSLIILHGIRARERACTFKYLNLNPTNTEVFCDKTPHLTNCAGGNYQIGDKISHLTDCVGGNYQVGDNINVVESGHLTRLFDNSTNSKKQKVT
ncbi:hypothetical protein DVH24_014775 [Malus domestica]|uniref:Uncharacterized protein n=1 Tax=Malus domestica TaxID=3750 RepID=A0A498K1V7_MALDO|nr:hypothetical protein DVH24_014775 [Malus domestica]